MCYCLFWFSDSHSPAGLTMKCCPLLTGGRHYSYFWWHNSGGSNPYGLLRKPSQVITSVSTNNRKGCMLRKRGRHTQHSHMPARFPIHKWANKKWQEKFRSARNENLNEDRTVEQKKTNERKRVALSTRLKLYANQKASISTVNVPANTRTQTHRHYL